MRSGRTPKSEAKFEPDVSEVSISCVLVSINDDEGIVAEEELTVGSSKVSGVRSEIVPRSPISHREGSIVSKKSLDQAESLKISFDACCIKGVFAVLGPEPNGVDNLVEDEERCDV